MRWQAQYTQVYSDDIETIAPILTPAFSLGPAGSLTSNTAEVIAGSESINGSYSGAASNTAFLQTNPAVLPLAPNHSYTLTFQYKILTPPGNYFSVQFYSQTAGSQGNFLPGTTVPGGAGATGTVTLTSALGNFTDYYALWIIGSAGAISVDNIQITDTATGKVIASRERRGQGAHAQIRPSIAGRNCNHQSFPGDLWQRLAPAQQPRRICDRLVRDPNWCQHRLQHQVDYRVLSPTTVDVVFYAWLQPAGSTDQHSQVTIPATRRNAAVTGTFSY